MATYVNDLRLKEIGTGESSGTWGTETNTNLELIGEALGYATEGITTNADTHATTVADGSTDPGRAMYIKYTGPLDSACTITSGPNTMSRVPLIEHATSGSQNIIISQGSGANITIPAGDVKMVYLDGAGSGAAVVDAFASLSVVDLKVQDDLTVTDDLTVNGDIDLEGSIDVNGTTNLDVVDIDGALTQDGGAVFNETGADVDHRIESNTNSNSFFLEGSTSHIGLGTGSPDDNSFGAGHGILAVASATGSAKTAMLNLMGDGNDTDATRVASIFFNDQSATGAGKSLAGVEAYRASNHATDPGGDLVFSTNTSGGSYAERLRIAAAGTATFQHPIVVQSGATQGYYIENNAGNATTPRITNDANDHTVIRPGKSGGGVQFNNCANDALRMLLLDSGNLGLGVSPDYKMHIYASDSGASAHANADDLFIESSGSTGMTIASGSSSNGSIFFADSDSTIVGQVEYDHANNLMNFIAGGSTSIRVSSTGLLFGGDTAAANTLHDYEEGSFTIGISGGTFAAGNATAYYVKVGQMVWFYWYSGGATINSVSGNALLTGLPFTANSTGYTLFQYVHGNAVDGNSRGGYINVSNTNAPWIDDGAVAQSSFNGGSGQYIMVQGMITTDS